MISALVLAAGAGRRFGHEQKLLQLLEGRPIVRWAVDSMRTAVIDEVIVVVAAEHAGIERALQDSGARLVVNPNATGGMGTSIAAGVAALSNDVEAVLISLGDIPHISPAVIARLVARFRAGGADLVIPEYHGLGGHPVLFARARFPDLLRLRGDQGARALRDLSPDRVAIVAVNEPAPADVDTIEDLARLRGTAHHTSTPTH
jgi:molybdenum cofactor cytidylyltransferase